VKVEPNNTFTDSTKYDADAMKFNFDRQRKENTTRREALASITDVSVVDSLSVRRCRCRRRTSPRRRSS
jgi:ABC-type transport system substrate-binding protein